MDATEELVVLVDEHDAPVGTMGKLEAHRSGALHRAFSVFIFNTNGELLLQQRAFTKYHSGGSWSNTCCGHPRPHEDVLAGAQRRLFEEMGIVCPLRHEFSFRYRTDVGQGLVENELDHVIFGRFDGLPDPSPTEAAAWRCIGMDALAAELHTSPQSFTPWLHACFDRVHARTRSTSS